MSNRALRLRDLSGVLQLLVYSSQEQSNAVLSARLQAAATKLAELSADEERLHNEASAFLLDQAARLESLAHNVGPALKHSYRMETFGVAAQLKMAAGQLPHLNAWKEALNAQS